MDVAERARLEAGFAREISQVIDSLAYSGMSEDDFSTFETSLKTFLKYEDIKGFVLDSLLAKAKEVARLVKSHDVVRLAAFRKLSKILVRCEDRDNLSIFSTYLLANRCHPHFMGLIEEMINQGVSFVDAEQVFFSLIHIHAYDVELIEQYLTTIKEDASYLTRRLLQTSTYSSLIKFIRISAGKHDVIQNHVVPTIMEHYTGDRTHYLNLVAELLHINNNNLDMMLKEHKHIGNCEGRFQQYLIEYHWHIIIAVRNYANYLNNRNPEDFAKFEEQYIKYVSGAALMAYAELVDISSKRKILLRFLDMKDEKYVVEFIRKFPTYRSLLPML